MLSSRFLFLRGLIVGKSRLRGLLGLFGLMLSLSIGLGAFTPLWSQTPSPSSKDACSVPLALCADIQSLAQEDVVDDIPRRTAHAIDLFKEKHPDWQNDPNKAKREVSRIYDREYSRREKTKKQDLPSIWKKLTENGFLIPVLGLVLFALTSWFKDGIGRGLTALTKKIDDWVYGRFAGTLFFESLALKRYREALVENYQELKIPFRVNHKPLDMSEIYVPLKVAGSSDNEQIDAYGSISKYRRLMIKGIPGSGKTMLLRHVAFSYGKGNLMGLENRPVPVLLELRRLNDADLTEDKLIEAIVEAFKRNRFPKAERFVRHSLEQGKLMLLLDGLDEVNNKVRLALAQKISDLLQSLDKKQGCRLIVTCRTAVYNNEFVGEIDQMLEVVEFTDQQIRRFLEAWKNEIPVGKSIDQLIQTLRDRPQIMSLARNPLLLTIVVHLYTDSAFELPRSRAEFYQESTRILLDQWQDQFNKYRGADKRRVLQQLALYQQKNSTEQLKDRRSIDDTVVSEQIRQLLPSLNLDPKNDIIPLLNELVERSGLFLKIDGGDRYQFAHLTLQEYFTAMALKDKSDELLPLFEKDPMNWREVVKLWCGLSGDSTFLITKIFEIDKLLSFECLADAQEVEQGKANEIVKYFQELVEGGDDREEVIKAFGAVAANDRPIGKKIFDFLETLLTSRNQYHEKFAAKALSLTNSPKAAEVLAGFFLNTGRHLFEPLENHQPLIRMGDLAVPYLHELSLSGSVPALESLHSIGTPSAAIAIVSSIWFDESDEQQFSGHAAIYLANLLTRKDIEDCLSRYSVSQTQSNLKRLDWVWKPFEEPGNSTMPIIAGRIAYLLSEIQLSAIPEPLPFLDLRLVFPVCAIQLIDRSLPLAISRWKALSYGMDHTTRTQLNNVFNQSKPTINDWINIFQPIKFNFEVSWHYRFALIISLLLSLLASVGTKYIALTCMVSYVAGMTRANASNLILNN
jgi:hypothetical protein